MNTTDHDRIVDKIQKLLAKAESTTHQAEADALFAKAQEWMIQYAIDEARLISEGKARHSDPVMVEVVISDPHFRIKASLLGSVCEAHDCKAVILSSKARKCSIVGMPRDIEFVQMLFLGLLMQLTNAQTRNPVPAHEDSRAWRKGIATGFVNEVDRRMKETIQTREQAESKVKGTGTDLVLRDSRQLVDQAFKTAYPNVTISRSRASFGSYGGYSRGVSEGGRADISGGRNTINTDRKGLHR